MRINKNFIIAFSILLSFPLFTKAQQNDKIDQVTHVTLQGSNLKIDIPDVFKYDNIQNAYIYSGAAASISAKELMSTPFSSLKKSMTAGTLENQQMKVVETSVLRTNSGLDAILYRTTLTVRSKDGQGDTEFERLVFICGNSQKSACVTMQYPVVTKKVLWDVLRSCLLSIEL